MSPLRLWLRTLGGAAGTVRSVREEGPIPDARTRFSSQREDEVDDGHDVELPRSPRAHHGALAVGGHGRGGHAAPLPDDRRGIFAVGDVRSGSVKRVASAVGEGSVVVSAVHAHLATGDS